MKTKETIEIDLEGYIKVPNSFERLGYLHQKIEDLGGDWCIYKRTNTNTGVAIGFELVHLKRSEEYELKGNVIPKKWTYPGDESFGRLGFACNSIERARQKYKELIGKHKEVKQEALIPKGVRFSVSGLAKQTGVAYHKIVAAIDLLGDKVQQVELIKNKIGKPTRVFVYNP